MSEKIENVLSFIKSIIFSNEFTNEINEALESLSSTIESCKGKVKVIEKIAPRFDFNDQTPGNGLRSFVDTFECAINKIIELCMKIKKSKFGKVYCFHRKKYLRCEVLTF